ncbi:PXA domain-containing protein [Xylariales sp. PMI_506]|nr:PXA domain-containing protein [Xylariales sp. PMI_506]
MPRPKYAQRGVSFLSALRRPSSSSSTTSSHTAPSAFLSFFKFALPQTHGRRSLVSELQHLEDEAPLLQPDTLERDATLPAVRMDHKKKHDNPDAIFRLSDDEASGSGNADEVLGSLGYKAELCRNRSTLQVAFMSFVLASIPYGLATTLFYPLNGGGPVDVIWGWVAVSLIIICVAASLGEITSVYPTAGGVYYQTWMLAPSRWRHLSAWICGWLYVVGNITITLSVNFGSTTFLVACINVFETADGEPIFAGEPYQVFLIFLGITLLCNAVSSLCNRWLPWLDTFAIFWTFAGVIAIMVCVLVIAKNGRHDTKYVFTHFESSSGWTPGWSFMVGLLHAAYATSATGMVISMCEEVQQPATQVPKAMVLTVLLNTVAGLMLLIPLVYVLPDISELVSLASGQPVPTIIKSAVGSAGGAFGLLVPLLVLAVLCGIGCTTAASRAVWAFARDGAIPGSSLWKQVNHDLDVPLNAMMLSMAVQILLGFIYFGSSAAFSAFSGVGVIALTTAYVAPIVVSLIDRRETVKTGRFYLGKFGTFANYVSIGWSLLVIPLFCMPSSIPVNAATMNYASVVFAGFTSISIACPTGPENRSDTRVIPAPGFSILTQSISYPYQKLRRPQQHPHDKPCGIDPGALDWIMALKGRDVVLSGIVCFVAWGYAVSWWPTIRWTAYAFVAGCVTVLVAVLALVLLTSKGSAYRHSIQPARPNSASFVGPLAWRRETSSLRVRQIYTPVPLYPDSRKISHALDGLLALIVRDFVQSWYSHISKNPVFANEVDKTTRIALANIRDRLLDVDLVEVVTSRIVPILTAHFRDFHNAERAVRGRKLNRNVTESEELDLAIAAKYKEGKLHPAASLAYSDTKMVQQEHLRKTIAGILPKVLPTGILGSRAVSTIVREIVSCAVLFPVMMLLSEPDTWNQLMENYGRSMLQDRSTVRKLRAALDAHASPSPRSSKAATFPRLAAGDSERRFEKYIRAIRKISNLSDARRLRSEVASQLKRDSEQEGQDQVYLRRLEMGKRLLDQRVQHLAAGGDRRHPATMTPTEPSVASVSKLENAPLADLLRDTSGLSYFMEYMDRQRMMPLVQFWLVVDGFRNPLEDDGPEDEKLPSSLPPWTESDRMDLAQIDQAYLSKPELNVPESSRKAIRDFLGAGKKATSEQYYRARRAVLRAQSAVLEEMRSKYFLPFKKSDLWYKCLASEEASKKAPQPVPMGAAGSSSHGPLPRTQSFQVRPSPVTRLNARLNSSKQPKRGLSATDLRVGALNGSNSPDPSAGPRRSLDENAHSPLFDDDDFENDPMGDSVQSLDQDVPNLGPDNQVVKTMEEVLNNIMEDDRPQTAEDLRQSLFGNGDETSSIFSGQDNGSTRGSIDVQRPPANGKEVEKPSLSSLGLVSAASRIGVFDDNDLFGDEDKLLGEDEDENNQDPGDVEDEVLEAAPGDLGLAEAITVLSNDIDRLVAQEAVIDSLTKKAELTNNTAELRILRKSKASLQRELRRKELQRQQYVIQESDNSLYGRSSIKIKAIQVGREEDGREYALYVIEVQRIAGEKMPAATWIVTRRYSEFHELHQQLRYRYLSVRNLDFPRRQMIMKLQSEFLRRRQQALEHYLQELLRLPEVCRSRDLRSFLSQSVIMQGEDLVVREDRKDMITRLYDSVADGMEDILGNIPVLDQLSVAGQNLIAAATNQLNTVPMPIGVHEDAMTAAEAEAELNAFEDKELEPFIKPICDIFLEVFELNRGNNWLRGRAVVVVLHQLLGGTIERKVRDNFKTLVQEDAILKYIGLLRDSMWPGGQLKRDRVPRTASEKAKTRTEAGLMLATLVPDLAGSVVGRLNAQAASRRVFATMNNSRLK